MPRPTNNSLTRDYLRDLVVDIRCARRDGLPEYAEKCITEFRQAYPVRHVANVNRWGIPQHTETEARPCPN